MITSTPSDKVRHIIAIIPKIAIACAIMMSCTPSTNNAAEKAELSEMTSSTSNGSIQSEELKMFLVRGVDMNSKAITEGNFIWMGDLPQSDQPDSYYDGFTLPITKSIITGKKSVINALAPNASCFIIDGKQYPKEKYDSLPAYRFQRVDIKGDTLIIETRYALDEPNSDVTLAIDEESRLYRREKFGPGLHE